MQEQSTLTVPRISIPLYPQTVLLLVGPSGCGKSHFARSLQSQLGSYECEVISSDDLRRQLLGHNFSKYHPLMMQVSTGAFGLLHEAHHQLMSYPVRKNVIVIDTTGLSEDFRNKIVEDSRQYQYRVEMVLFSYDDRQDYFRFMSDEPMARSITAKHVQRFRQEVLGQLNRRQYDAVHRIPGIRTPHPVVHSYPLKDERLQAMLEEEISIRRAYPVTVRNHTPEGSVGNSAMESLIIGDVHGCYDELLELLRLAQVPFEEGEGDEVPRISFENRKRIILVGDLVDKGPKSKEVLKFVLRNSEHISWVYCNHLNYLLMARFRPDGTPPITEYFTCLAQYAEDDEFWDLALQAASHAMPFIIDDNDRFIVTHAPCQLKFLGKLDPFSQKQQRNFRFEKTRKDFETAEEYESWKENELLFLKKEANISHPYHFFGHVMFQDAFRYKNKFFLDSGCYAGYKLTGVVVTMNGDLFWKSVPSKQPRQELVSPPLWQKGHDAYEQLDPRDQRRARISGEQKIQFISGTISPSDRKEGVLESLDAGLDYFRQKGEERVVVQTKHMGSRCNVYVSMDPEIESFATSRNGFVIRPDRVDMSAIFAEMKERVPAAFGDNVKMVLVDGELMPWSALGKGLIQGDFLFNLKCIETENKFLTTSGFLQQYQQLKARMNATEFRKDQTHLSGKDLAEKYGPNYESFRAILQSFETRPHFEGEAIFRRQILSHAVGAVGEEAVKPEFWPFAILKVIYKDGTEKTCLDQDLSNVVENYLVATSLVERELPAPQTIDLNDPEEIEELRRFTHKLREQGLEGIVLKPTNFNFPGAPYLKVRNEDYLTIVYGHDYQDPKKYQKILSRKSTRHKLKISENEWKIGMEMLRIPYAQVSRDNPKYLNLVSRMIENEKQEKFVDPRL